jgi:hypothetical protein
LSGGGNQQETKRRGKPESGLETRKTRFCGKYCQNVRAELTEDLWARSTVFKGGEEWKGSISLGASKEGDEFIHKLLWPAWGMGKLLWNHASVKVECKTPWWNGSSLLL